MTGRLRDSDVELTAGSSSLPRRLDGYPSFAEFIAQDGDAAIYRKFSHLSARNLLYLQSELHNLEGRLQQLDEEDAKGLDNEDAQKAVRDWRHFSDPGNARAQKHRELQEQVRGKIKEYHKALVLESQVLALNPPNPRTLRAFRKWFTTVVPVLWGRDKSLFDHAGDLVALAPVDTDRLNIVLQTYFGWMFKEKGAEDSNCHDRSTGLFYYPAHRVQRAGAVISVLFSAVLLIGAIVCLLLISEQRVGLRVGMIVLFTCLFAFVVGLVTNARRAEIFGSTAAYAAVLVVFVSNNLSSNST